MKDTLQTMRLLLVRHGESVDNVAGVYAGSRDSALTAHGVLQARRLGTYLMPSRDGDNDEDSKSEDGLRPVVTHVLSSDLQRAVRTAEAIVEAQAKKRTGDDGDEALAVVQLADLRERDFRSGEGRRIAGSGSSSAFADAETREEMRRRAERFVDGHLHPLLLVQVPTQQTVVVVSHGIFLGVLLSVLLQRFASSSLPAAPVSWSNTGYVELAVGRRQQQDVELAVTAVNNVEHLQGLRKTRGGIGSSAFDAKQQTVDSFFRPAAKRQKKEG
ncbi:phosphoglycerate mutase family protein [Grosmannia clavigera kw1407]|uniref:Phosphoglycerate mutase family protein n=1 Tax=Grosmannia clavigera (strain kw1407 / UAMH 11150) TaxID=655863 RepID=F0X7D9_GROCL|nr:phosphoglycerate mutase family protein [Grosmannia clavigera kw1407]EFX06346.1 phosphoglycerate mutase family protein [Grosmannia clavigera kw1407]